jgi:hypothetical protein
LLIEQHGISAALYIHLNIKRMCRHAITLPSSASCCGRCRHCCRCCCCLQWHQVFERLPEPPAPDDLSVWGDFEQASERLYMIGLNGRGQAVLRNLGVMDRIDTASSLVLGRFDWQPNSAPDSPKPTYYTTRTYKTRCIQRDRLASCLLQELREKHAGAVSVTFDAQCVQAEWRQSSKGGQEVSCAKTAAEQQVLCSCCAASGGVLHLVMVRVRWQCVVCCVLFIYAALCTMLCLCA